MHTNLMLMLFLLKNFFTACLLLPLTCIYICGDVALETGHFVVRMVTVILFRNLYGFFATDMRRLL